MEDEREELSRLTEYLKDSLYSAEQIEFIMTAFKTLQNHYDYHSEFDPEMIDRIEYINKYTDLLRRIEPIIFLTDINKDPDFINHIKPLGDVKMPSGYVKDDNGLFRVTHNKPEYWCSLMGLTDSKNETMTLLFDETIDFRMNFAFETVFHELAHTDQTGFTVPWYIMHRASFIKMLQEGHAMMESKYALRPKTGTSCIPFAYDEVTNKFQITDSDNDYKLYRYLYFKLEVLLGRDFMNSWATATKDTTFIIKAKQLIDAKYGIGTFKKLYECIIVILTSRFNYTEQELEDLVVGEIYVADLPLNKSGDSLEELIIEYKKVCDALDNQELFKVAFEAEKIKLSKIQKNAKGMDLGGTQFIDYVNRKIDSLTEESFRDDLERTCSTLEDEIDAKSNIEYYKFISSSNLSVCKELRNNKDYLTSAIVRLEKLMLTCIHKDLDDHLVEGHGKFKKYNYYIYNVGSNSFKHKIMKKAKAELEFLSMDSFLQQLAVFSQSNEIPSQTK